MKKKTCIKPSPLPSRVRITNKIYYEIVYSDLIRGDKNCLGACDSKKKLILIKRNLNKEDMLITFIHELFHALELEKNIPIPHSLIYILDKHLLKVLRLNKWLD